MKTYNGLTAEYFRRLKRLDKIAKTEGAKAPFPAWMRVHQDAVIARGENSELFDYQLKRAYPKEGALF